MSCSDTRSDYYTRSSEPNEVLRICDRHIDVGWRRRERIRTSRRQRGPDDDSYRLTLRTQCLYRRIVTDRDGACRIRILNYQGSIIGGDRRAVIHYERSTIFGDRDVALGSSVDVIESCRTIGDQCERTTR